MNKRDKVWPKTLETLEVHAEQPETFLHSDVHIGNWYCTGDGAMGLCDWQCANRGHWSRDLSYVISAALTVDDRRQWERDLVRRYIEQRKEKGPFDTSFDQAFAWYGGQMLHALMMWTPTLCHSEHLPHMQSDDTSRAMIERMCAAIDDLDVLA